MILSTRENKREQEKQSQPRRTGLQGTKNQEKAAAASYNPAYEYTKDNVIGYWLHLSLFIVVFAMLAMITLEFIDKDKR